MISGIFITGASSGLGAALAVAYATPNSHLFLSGRDTLRLNTVVDSCRSKGAQASVRAVDVTDGPALAQWITDAEAIAPLALVIANAGISGGTGGGAKEPDNQTRKIFAVNLDGVVNTVLPAIAVMRPRHRGQIALISSVAGFRGQPSAPAYSASKAAVRVWGEGLRGSLAKEGIGVTVICPGFVETRMTAVNRFPMPFLMPADRAAGLMRRAIDANRARLTYPWPMAVMSWLLAALPPAWTDPLLTRLPGKD
ncbi:MAG: SDR family NAD(P)-dependent oxidoreductase [Telmatospirillum sp.]|nr:SDR family NAD(P)-dependent oxidoreductase [Telmatospirillum sp.]MDR3441207.1 SDR family NAD(P)-dependent oxidoreductase [Telmatospirillum sp.]